LTLSIFIMKTKK